LTQLTIKEAAHALEISESGVKKAIARGKLFAIYVDGVGQGGKQLRVILENLPQESRDRYHGKQQEHSYDVLLSLNADQRAKVASKQSIVQAYWNFKAMYPKQNKLEAFLQQHNERNPEKTISKRELIRWQKVYETKGVAGLVDTRGQHRKGLQNIPEDVRKVFLSYWLQEKGTNNGGPSVSSCYRLTLLQFPDLELPGVRTFQRLANKIPLPAQTLHREGKKAFDDKCMPYLAFDYYSISSNRQWVADNHRFDVLVKYPSGHIGRPWLIGWMDRRSRQIVGYLVIEQTPNADFILDAFARSVYRYGIPESVLLDNGKDYTVHDLFNHEAAYSLANEMKISVTNATPYNAKAKPIERFFRTLEESYCIFLDSYIGSNPKKRPEGVEEKVISYYDFLYFIEDSIKIYNNAPHSGEGMDGKSPKEVYQENAESIRTASPELLSLYFKRTARPAKVGRNGIRVSELQQFYDADELFEYQGQKVYARYNTDDVTKVYCFNEQEEFICIATSAELATLDKKVTAQNNRELNAKKKHRRKAAREQKPDIEMPSILQLAEEIARENDIPNEVPPQNEPAVAKVISLKHHKQAKAVKTAEKTKQAKENKQKVVSETRNDRMEAYFRHMTGG